MSMGFSTDAIHAGQEPDPLTGAVVPPIYQTSTYVQEALGRHKGFEYARTHNPTRSALERRVAALEKGNFGVAFSSGVAALHAILTLLRTGDHVVASRSVYGGTYRLFEKVLRPFGLEFSWISTCSAGEVADALRPTTRLIHVETPSNPLVELSDIREIARLAKSRHLLLSVDNTFLSPYLQRPLELGADLVVHSTTKFLNGHSDSIGGIVVLKDDDLAQRLYFIQNAAGAILSPFDSWLVLRGLKTLAVRMRAHEENARILSRFLDQHPAVRCVHYPGLSHHAQHELAKRQQDGFGAVISFELAGMRAARQLLNRVALIRLAESLGGVESLISHPASMSHASLPAREREAVGIRNGLVRLSVGIEDLNDLQADLEQALAGSRRDGRRSKQRKKRKE